MDIDSDGLPIHADATAGIRSRIFLEGNFYVDLHPGTPERPDPQLRRDAAGRQHVGPGAARSRAVGAGHRLPREPAEARAGLRRVAERPAERRPGRRQTGPERPRADRGAGAEPVAAATPPARSRPPRSSTRRCSATQPHDLSRAVQGNEEVFRALASRQGQLRRASSPRSTRRWRARGAPERPERDDRGAAAAAAHDERRADARSNASFGPTKTFAKAILPGHQAARSDDRRGAAVARAGDRAARAERARRPGVGR